MITLNTDQHEALLDSMRGEYPPSVLLIRDCMRRVCGFTIREDRRDWPDIVYYLDFHDDRMESWFHIKYADIVCLGCNLET